MHVWNFECVCTHTCLSGRTNYRCFKIWWVPKPYSSATGRCRYKVVCVAYFQTYHIHLCYIHQAVKMQTWLSCLSHGMTVQVGQHCAPSISVFMPLLCLVTFWCQSACKDSLFALIVVIWLRFTRFEDSHNWDLHFLFLASLCLCVHAWSIWFVLRSKVRSGKEWTHSLPPVWIALPTILVPSPSTTICRLCCRFYFIYRVSCSAFTVTCGLGGEVAAVFIPSWTWL